MFEIRPATLGDLSAMVALLGELFALERDFAFAPAKQEQGLRLLLEDPTALLLVAASQDQVCAMVSLQTLISTAEGARVGLLEDLVVTKSMQGQGLGQALLAAVATWAQTQDLPRIQLLADQTNLPALEFYHRQGWQSTQIVALRRQFA